MERRQGKTKVTKQLITITIHNRVVARLSIAPVVHALLFIIQLNKLERFDQV